MQFQIVPLYDATKKKWYGVLIVQMGSSPARIVDQTDPIYNSKEECYAEIQKMLESGMKEMLAKK